MSINQTLSSKFEQVLLVVGAAILIIMTAHTALDVIMRNLAGQPILGTYEFVTYWYMVAVTAVGLWAAETKEDHITVTLITDQLSDTGRFVQILLTRIVTIIFLAFITWHGFQGALEDTAIKTYTGASEIPIWPAKYFLPLGFTGFALVLAARTIHQLKTKNVQEDREDFQEVL